MLAACKPMGTEMTSEDQPSTNADAVQTTEKIAYNKQTSARPVNSPATTGLQLLSSETDELGYQHLKYRQLYKGVPVWQSDMIMHINAEQEIYRVDGQHRKLGGDLDVSPTLSDNQAADKAAEALSESGRNWLSETRELIIFPAGEKAMLAWLIELSSGLNRKSVIIDAHNGAVLKILEGNWS